MGLITGNPVHKPLGNCALISQMLSRQLNKLFNHSLYENPLFRQPGKVLIAHNSIIKNLSI